jgi:hypothetical protein
MTNANATDNTMNIRATNDNNNHHHPTDRPVTIPGSGAAGELLRAGSVGIPRVAVRWGRVGRDVMVRKGCDDG